MSPSFMAPTAFGCDVADAVVGKGDRLRSHRRALSATGFSEFFGDRGPWGGRNARAGSPCRRLSEISVMVGRDAFETRGVGDLAVLHRHVEVDAHENAFSLHVDIVEGAEIRS